MYLRQSTIFGPFRIFWRGTPRRGLIMTRKGKFKRYAQLPSTSGVNSVYYLVFNFLAAADFHGIYGDERRFSR